MEAATVSLALEQLLRSRRSVRRFREEPLPRALIERVLELATLAPSAHNRQPWRFAVLTSQERKGRLAEVMGAEFRRALEAEGLSEPEIEARLERSRRRLVGAPAAVVLCVDATGMDSYDDPRRQEGERQMAAQSAALAGGYLLLAAHAEGLGAVWTCAPLFVPEVVRAALDLPESWQAQALLLLGQPAEEPLPRPRRPLAEVVRFL